MVLIRTVRALAFGIAAAMAATTPAGSASPDSQNQCAKPLAPKQTVYRPDCWPDISLIDSPRCVRAPE